MTNRFAVSKSHPAIKAILAATFPKWKGRRIAVVEASDSWLHTVIAGDDTNVVGVRMSDCGCCHVDSVVPFERPVSGSHVDYTARTVGGGVLVIHREFNGGDLGIEIVVPSDGLDSLDHAAIAVAVDAVLVGGKPSAVRRRVDEALASCGKMLGIASAVAYSEAKLLIVRAETQEALVDATSLAAIDAALDRLRRISFQAHEQMVKQHGGLSAINTRAIRLHAQQVSP